MDSRNEKKSVKITQIHTHMLDLPQIMTKLDIVLKGQVVLHGILVLVPKNGHEWAFVYTSFASFVLLRNGTLLGSSSFGHSKINYRKQNLTIHQTSRVFLNDLGGQSWGQIKKLFHKIVLEIHLDSNSENQTSLALPCTEKNLTRYTLPTKSL